MKADTPARSCQRILFFSARRVPGIRPLASIHAAAAALAVFCELASPVFADQPTLPGAPAPLASAPMRVVAGKFVVDAYLDGHGPFAIGIDSGAETLVITQRVARACRFTLRRGTVAVTGTASSAARGVPQALVGSIRIGPVTVAKPFCTVAPALAGVDGYIGAPLLNAYVTEIDPQARVVRLYSPASFESVASPEPAGNITRASDSPLPTAPAGASESPAAPAPTPTEIVETTNGSDQFGVVVPITLGFHRVPVVQSTLGGLPARLEIDTGSAFPAELTARFVSAKNLAHRFDRIGSLELRSSGVVGRAGVYALDDLTLGDALPSSGARGGSSSTLSSSVNASEGADSGASVKGTIPTLFLAGPATGSEQQYDGRIGAPLLLQFAVTFDYARSRVLLRPVDPTPLRLPRLAQ